ncbi:EAL domain-containing protein [Permianibacter sp. IMCC34836]|uniref:EAL domain-containing protein n=1 Tax=Permianibacter fluminis TaxID=2738515 RepID=UPI00155371A7|nr:EAL domain-containing protein [Permianibacter fluminis]NQD38453.1 EAL domain-containing protein [Permianibacter fluminis]
MFELQATSSRPPIILIVDDVIDNIRILGAILEGFGELMFATSGKEALALARQQPPDLALLDIEMPEMDGYELFAALTADPLTANCAVIFVTASPNINYELQSLAIGGVDFITKPLDPSICRVRIQNHLLLRQRAVDLAKANTELRMLVDHLPAFIGYWNTDLTNLFSNDSLGSWFGKSPDEMRGLAMSVVVGKELHEQLKMPLQQVALHGQSAVDVSFIDKAGSRRYAKASLVSRQDHGVLMLLTDISSQKRAELALEEQKERLHITLNSIGDAVIATDIDSKITLMNPIAEAMTGWSLQEALGQAIETVMPLIDGENGNPISNPVRMAIKDRRRVGMALDTTLRGREQDHYIEDSAAPIIDHSGRLSGAIVVFHDVSEARAMALKMSHLANHDALTDLPNRVLLHDRLSQALHTARRSGAKVAMLMMDFDNFKYINDSVGHAVGDDLLQQAAIRLQKQLRGNDTISRFGGDEFILLIPDLRSAQNAEEVAKKLQQVMSPPFSSPSGPINLSLSIGISLFPDDAADPETMMRHADVAMYRAKKEGRDCFRFFSHDLEEQVLLRQRLEAHLREALTNNRLEVFYQTKVQMKTGEIVGAEALIRMRDAGGQLISPAQFIPLAEETGLIETLDKLVLEQACSQIAKWSEAGKAIKVSVNISARHFGSGLLPNVVADVLTRTGIAPSLLELEITESSLMGNIDSAQTSLSELKALGVCLSIDDFGTGYSSLAYLKRFSVDTVKIDKSFIHDMLADKSDLAIVKAIITLSETLGLGMIAEGVETQEQADALIEMGCLFGQGFLYCRPAPPDQLFGQHGDDSGGAE